jgi:hypothetical protein
MQLTLQVQDDGVFVLKLSFQALLSLQVLSIYYINLLLVLALFLGIELAKDLTLLLETEKKSLDLLDRPFGNSDAVSKYIVFEMKCR